VSERSVGGVWVQGVGGALHLLHSQQSAGTGENDATIWHLTATDGHGDEWTAPQLVSSKRMIHHPTTGPMND
jgi:hypothetical protein